MAKNTPTKDVILSFRVAAEIEELLAGIIRDNAKSEPAGVTSTRTLARRVVTDFARGRVVYKNPDDFLTDGEEALVAEAELAALKKQPKRRGRGRARSDEADPAPAEVAPRRGRGAQRKKSARKAS